MSKIKNIMNRFSKRHSKGTLSDLQNVFSEFSKSLTLIVDLEQLKDNVIANIREVVQLDRILIYLLDEDKNRYVLSEARGYKPHDESAYYFLPENPFIRWFNVNQTYLELSQKPEVVSFFDKREQYQLHETGMEYVFPLIAMNRITGVVCLGAQPPGKRVKHVEIELLKTFLGQAAIAFENAYLYQQQKTRLKKMFRADRLAILGQLAAGAAHEIRNPLTSIRSTIQYLRKDVQDESKKQLVNDMLEEVDRINEIIEGMLSFSRPVKPVKERVDLKLLLEQTIKLVATTAREKNVEIMLHFDADKSHFTADPAQLKQVFLNIIMNALEASEDKGEIDIHVNLHEKSADFARKARKYFSLVFQDFGIGIPQKNLEHLFDPFFTTKKNGTGLGMSITYGIIQQHGGDIEIESRTQEDYTDNHGTKVTVWLIVE